MELSEALEVMDGDTGWLLELTERLASEREHWKKLAEERRVAHREVLDQVDAHRDTVSSLVKEVERLAAERDEARGVVSLIRAEEEDC